MSKPKVAVVDYGMGNLFSVVQALEHCGAEVKLTEEAADLEAADAVVLPGVGAFGNGMDALAGRGLVEPLRKAAREGKPFLGICLGMQMMFDYSEEFGHHEGLKLLPGSVVPIPNKKSSGEPRKIPHIGWGRLRSTEKSTSDAFVGQWVPADGYVYFVHSLMAVPKNASDQLAACEYDGTNICAVIRSKNLLGCQFHPERSGEVGLGILKRFVEGCR